jgi:periplasmic divalent cation tolerance protein
LKTKLFIRRPQSNWRYLPHPQQNVNSANEPRYQTMPPTDALLVLATLPDEASARALAEKLVSERLAACVNILAPCTSVYRWQGKVEISAEIPLLVKTTRARYSALEAAVRAAHPYELPELIAVSITQGLTAYLDWLADSVTIPVSHAPDAS